MPDNGYWVIELLDVDSLDEGIGSSFLRCTYTLFQYLKACVDNVVAQVSEEEFFTQIDSESLSMALLIKHLSGNIRSRWTNFFTEDGEKLWRNRDSEFINDEGATREALLERWEDAWKLFFSVIEPLQEEDLVRTIQIRWKDYIVVNAICRHLSHVSQHVGQIIFLAKHFKQEAWQTLTTPKGKSEEFNERIRKERLGK